MNQPPSQEARDSRAYWRRAREFETQLADKEAALQRYLEEQEKLTRLVERQRDEIERLRRLPSALRWLSRSSTLPRLPRVPWYRRLFRTVRRRVPQRAVQVVRQSGYFDADWYLAQYPELQRDRLARRNPALHYLKKGGFEGLNPGPDFDSRWYLQRYPDIRAIGINPLVHYVLHGADEGRKAVPYRHE